MDIAHVIFTHIINMITLGQSKTKAYPSDEAAEKDATKQIKAKQKKGYEQE